MKKILLIKIVVLLATVTTSAQDIQNIYKKYSEYDSVNSMYISPELLRIIGQLPDMCVGKENVNLTQSIRSFLGMYIIYSYSSWISVNIRKEIEAFVTADTYEILMEAKDCDYKMRIYIVGDNEMVKRIILLKYGRYECAFICLEGSFSRPRLEEVFASVM